MSSSFRRVPQEARDRLVARVRPLATDGRHERFKSTQFFDGPYHQRQHGFVPPPMA